MNQMPLPLQASAAIRVRETDLRITFRSFQILSQSLMVYHMVKKFPV